MVAAIVALLAGGAVLVPPALAFQPATFAGSLTPIRRHIERGYISATALPAVTFRYSLSSFDHLKALDDGRSAGADSSDDANSDVASATRMHIRADDTNNAMQIAILGALASMALTVCLCQVLVPPEFENLSLVFAAAATVAGYKVMGGDEARESDLPKDGGYDAKFVVDKTGRLRDIIRRIETEKLENVKAGQSNNYNIIESDPKGDRDLSNAIRLIDQVHGHEYVKELIEAVEDARATDRIRRLHPVVMRSLVDKYSYDAAVDGVADWIDCVDDAMGRDTGSNDDVVFALTRPPSHHACKSRGSGGCLLNGPAIAAFRALETGAERVAILDIDAHHGNGIANCVQNESRIKYCSIHEEVIEKNWFKSAKDEEKKEKSVDPRSPFREDVGPLGNICNIPLAKGTRWDGEGGYQEALIDQALPFLTGDGNVHPDVLIVAAGFDALAIDATSRLALETEDYKQIGQILRGAFGSRVSIGLEGGYVWQDGTLGNAVIQLVKPWAGGPTSTT